MKQTLLQEAVRLLEQVFGEQGAELHTMSEIGHFLSQTHIEDLVAVSERHYAAGTRFTDIDNELYIKLRSTTFNSHAVKLSTGEIISTHRIFQKVERNGY